MDESEVLDAALAFVGSHMDPTHSMHAARVDIWTSILTGPDDSEETQAEVNQAVWHFVLSLGAIAYRVLLELEAETGTPPSRILTEISLNAAAQR